MDKPNVVVVGYGFAGRFFHSYLVNRAVGLNLYGVVTSRSAAAEDIRQTYGARIFESFEDAITDPKVDLLVLATPNDLHKPQAITAMAAGKHVVTDKPLCLNQTEASSMLQASRHYHRLLSVFQNRRWDGDYLTVRRVLQDGLLGDLFLIDMAWGQHGLPRGWRSQQQHGGGKFIDLGAHMVDQALQLVDSPVDRVYARFFNKGWNTDVDDHAHCVISFVNGVDVQIETSSLARRVKPRWRVLGTHGSLVKEGIDPQEKAMIAGNIDTAVEKPHQRARLYTTVAGQTAEIVVDTVPGRWCSYYENIATALYDRDKLEVKPESSVAVMAVLEAAQRSSVDGNTVSLEGVVS